MTGQEPSARQTENATAVWPDWQKQLVAVLLLLCVPLVLYFMRPVMAPLLLTMAIAFVLMYPIRWLQKLNLSYRLAALLMYFVFLVVSMAAVIWFVAQAAGAMVDTIQSARDFAQQVFTGLTDEETGRMLNLDFIHDGFKALSVVGAGVSFLAAPSNFMAAVVERISRFTSFISGYSLVIVVLLFFLLEWPRTKEIVSQRIPPASRREYRILLERITGLAQNYLLGSLVIVLFYWGLTAILFTLSGVPNAIVLALLVSIPQFIPQGGGLVSALLVFGVTMATGSTTFAINRLIFAFIEMAIFMLLAGTAYYFVDVRIYSKSVNVPVWVILLGIVAFSAALGVIGAFIAAAGVAILGELLDFTLKKLQGQDPYPEAPAPPPAETEPISTAPELLQAEVESPSTVTGSATNSAESED